MSFQTVVIGGFVSKDPEVRTTPNGVKVTSFSIPVDVGYGERKSTLWFNCISFKEKAEFASKLKKGSSVHVTGTLSERSWDDKETGQKRTKQELIVDTINFLNSKPTGEGSSVARPNASAPRTATQAAPRAQAAPQTRSAAPTDIDDIFGDETGITDADF